MDYVLSQRLPPELVDIISRETHRLNMRPVLYQIQYCVVRIYADNEYGFISGGGWNYWELLAYDCDWDDELYSEVVKKSYYKKKRMNVIEN